MRLLCNDMRSIISAICCFAFHWNASSRRFDTHRSFIRISASVSGLWYMRP
jgi:hypothetical protein